MATSFDAPSIWSPFGPFSHGVVLGDGVVVHLKGQIPLDPEGRLLGKGDMRIQLRETLENIESVLESVGGTMADIVSLTHYTTDIDAFMNAGDVRREFFTPPHPISTTLGVARLFDPAVLVEIAAIAEIPRDNFKAPPSSPS